MIHAVITLAVQALLFLMGVPPIVLAGVAPVLYYAGREKAQAEHRIIQAKYGGLRANAPWWCGFEPAAWDAKSLRDLLLPMAAAAALAVALLI